MMIFVELCTSSCIRWIWWTRTQKSKPAKQKSHKSNIRPRELLPLTTLKTPALVNLICRKRCHRRSIIIRCLFPSLLADKRAELMGYCNYGTNASCPPTSNWQQHYLATRSCGRSISSESVWEEGRYWWNHSRALRTHVKPNQSNLTRHGHPERPSGFNTLNSILTLRSIKKTWNVHLSSNANDSSVVNGNMKTSNNNRDIVTVSASPAILSSDTPAFLQSLRTWQRISGGGENYDFDVGRVGGEWS